MKHLLPLLLLLIPIGIGLFVLSGCAGSQAETDLQSWLESPSVQSELGTLEGFAFGLLNTYLEAHVLATAPGSTPDFAPAEANVIPLVQKQYNLTTAQATYVVRQAEQKWLSEASNP